MTSKMEGNFKLVHPNKTSNVLHFPFAFKFPAKNSEFFRIIYLNFPPKKKFQKNLDRHTTDRHTTHPKPMAIPSAYRSGPKDSFLPSLLRHRGLHRNSRRPPTLPPVLSGISRDEGGLSVPTSEPLPSCYQLHRGVDIFPRLSSGPVLPHGSRGTADKLVLRGRDLQVVETILLRHAHPENETNRVNWKLILFIQYSRHTTMLIVGLLAVVWCKTK